MKIFVRAFLSFVLFLLPAAASAEINTREVLELSKRFQPKAYDYAEEQGADIVPTKDGRSYTLVWLPEGFDVKKDLVFVSLHGHQGFAQRDFQVWHKHIARKGWGFIGVQWWYGRSAESIGYAKPRDIYPWIVDALEKLGVPRGHVIFTGFSMGGANSYAVAYLDRKQETPYFALILSNAGAMEKDYPPNRPFLDAPEGTKSFDGADWILYCSENDEQREKSCEKVAWTKEVLEKNGAAVHKFIRDTVGGHGGFMMDSVCDPTLDLAENIVILRE